MQVLHAVGPQTAPLYSCSVCMCVCVCVYVCVCGKEREIPALGGPKMVGRERQTHLDMARMDRYACVRVCVRE